jgi:catechol 2,3-dioxygenase
MQSETTAGRSTTGIGPDGVRHPAFHHVNLKTNRIEEMVEWYGLVVGMRPNFFSGSFAFLTNDEANHRIAILGAPPFREDPDRETLIGMHHTAFEFDSLGDLLGRYETLKAAGILPVGCVDHGLTMSFYYADPDRNQVELQSDNFSDWERSAQWMRTSPEFAADQVGRFVDPDLLVAAAKEGLSPAEIHERAYAGGYEPENPPPRPGGQG